MKANLGIRPVLKYSAMAGVLAAVINNLYRFIYEAVTGFSIPELINIATITGASFAPVMMGGIFYFILERYFRSGTTIFIVLASFFTIASLAGPFASQLPDGSPTPDQFAWLTFPMHIVAGLCAILIIPRSKREGITHDEAHPVAAN